MNYYFAPLEGITGYVYRNAYHTFFEPLDKYFTPFLVPNQNKRFKTRELEDVLPSHNQGLVLIPQIMTNNAADFLWAAEELHQMGYTEVNLNLGCPARTVVTKGRGAGFLAKPEELDRFLDQIYTPGNIRISIKTRIGKHTPEEFYDLLPIFNKYPVTELIIHPRVQTDYYQNKPNFKIFDYAMQMSSNPVVYNGDLVSADDLSRLKRHFPSATAVMAGRGILRNPGLISAYKGTLQLDKRRLKFFHDRIYEDYQALLSGERNPLFKMKELWLYLHTIFTNSEKYFKKIKKAEKRKLYEDTVNRLFEEQDIRIS